MIQMDLMVDTLIYVSRPISEGVGTGVINSVILQNWILCFGEASDELRMIVASFEYWIENQQSPWVAFWYLITERLICLEIYTGIILVEVGETWRSLMEKCILAVAGP